MNPHKKYALMVFGGSVLAIFAILTPLRFVAIFWFVPTMPIILLRWANYSFKRLNERLDARDDAKRARKANRPTPAKESGD
ncbi:MAG: hypothetical protein KGL72_00325 [Actinomycetales bacterium]|nr:hypothetical protein [Actinomycetales bacterium]